MGSPGPGRRRWSLRVLIPTLILVCGLAIVALQFAITYHVASDRVRQEMTADLDFVGTWLARSTSRHLARGRPDLLEEEVRSMAGLFPDLEFVAIADEGGTPLATSDPAWRDRAIARHPVWRALTDPDRAPEPNGPLVLEVDAGRQLAGLFRYAAPTSPDAVDARERYGSILVSLDLRTPLRVVRLQRVLVIALAGGVAVALVATVFWYVFDRVLTRPLDRLTETVREIETGDFTAVDDSGRTRELGEIASALTRLDGTLREGMRTQAARNRLARIVEDSTSEIYIAEADTFRLLDANRAARENLGYALEEIDGLGPWDFVEGMGEKDVAALAAPLREGRLAVCAFEAAHRRRDGSIYPVATRLQFMGTQSPPVYVAIVEDITERERRDERIRLLERAIEAVDVGVAISDATHADSPLVYVNRTLCRMSGYRADELIGRGARYLSGDVVARSALARIDAAKARGESVQVLLEMARRDGTRYMNELSLSPVRDATGRLTHYIGINRDVTARLEGEAQVRQAQRIESVGLLAGGVAHDFNNHLSVVLGNLELLAPEIDEPDRRELLDDAMNAARMGALVTRRLLAFARQGQLEPVVVDVNERVDGAAGLLRSTIGEQIELTCTLAPDLWPALVDAGEIENAVVNLSINARDAMPTGGRIEIRTANVRVGDGKLESIPELAPGDYVALSVGDTGDGMSEQVRSRAFDPFFTTKEASKGSGLGLASVYGFARQSGGHVSIRSETGHGTLVTLYLPRCVGTRASAHAATSERPAPESRGGRILVVEDNDMVREVTGRRLVSSGFAVRQAASGVEALALLERDARFDLVLSDIVMTGGVSGYDVARRVREKLPDCRVLLTSGFADRMPDVEADLGLPPVLDKPHALAELLGAVRAALADGPLGA